MEGSHEAHKRVVQDPKNIYRTLGVDVDAGEAEIRLAKVPATLATMLIYRAAGKPIGDLH